MAVIDGVDLNRVLYFRSPNGTFTEPTTARPLPGCSGEPDFNICPGQRRFARMFSPADLSSDTDGRPMSWIPANSRVLISTDRTTLRQRALTRALTIPG